MIKVVDVFAGPGGLSEGFASLKDLNGTPYFEVILSIEKDKQAFETLKLRKFHHLLANKNKYYRFLRKDISIEELYESDPAAKSKMLEVCWHATLGPHLNDGEPSINVYNRIKRVLSPKNTPWVLIGGPPCQAYSLVGRSRNSGNKNYDPAKDARQTLYIEYLQILAENRPTIFVMENVKGLLSATLNDKLVFELILNDLSNPREALKRENRDLSRSKVGGYRVYSLTTGNELNAKNLNEAVINAEKYGIPQSRHRVILLGIKDDEMTVPIPFLKKSDQVATVWDVIQDLPPLRSGISPRREDSPQAWISHIKTEVKSPWVNETLYAKVLHERGKQLEVPKEGRGGEFVQWNKACQYKKDWYHSKELGGVCNHSSRSHMRADLVRYFFAACYAEKNQVSPSLKDFPSSLLPKHKNVSQALTSSSHFSDRFRVQVKNRPSTTVVSHISKDGHYYIHPDPLQCRSLTVREAARLQTFPDNYLFLGNRTSQYSQVGNAVPPLLSFQIANVIRQVLKSLGHL